MALISQQIDTCTLPCEVCQAVLPVVSAGVGVLSISGDCRGGALGLSFSRMRSEGFSFNSGRPGEDSCSRLVVVAVASATVRNRPQV